MRILQVVYATFPELKQIRAPYFPFMTVAIFLSACHSEPDFEVVEFNPFVNFQTEQDTLKLPMDMDDVILSGIIIPSEKQAADGFTMDFAIRNKSGKAQRYAYKIFYQNESYKHPEAMPDGSYNLRASENFYGSWQDAHEGFRLTNPIAPGDEATAVRDTFRIIGNPRDELLYYGAQPEPFTLTESAVEKVYAEIDNSPEWQESIATKALTNNIPEEEQRMLDALWMLREKRKSGNENNRWKRNPRTGSYRFLLVVVPEEDLEKVPAVVADIHTAQNDLHINPFYTIYHDRKVRRVRNMVVSQARQILTTRAKYNLGSGLYVDELGMGTLQFDTSYYRDDCGSNEQLFRAAQFEQYFHDINRKYVLRNLPVVSDVVGDNLTREEFAAKLEKYDDQRTYDNFRISHKPGRTVASDPEAERLTMFNPGSGNGPMRKENVGINTRIGLTYGKYVARIKFPATISAENVWNGLTCAFWLIFHEESEWNHRSACEDLGYLTKAIDGKNSPRLRTTHYSEIDFEILKTSAHWPASSYPGGEVIPSDTAALDRNIIVTCTNWDLGCRDVDDFVTGTRRIYRTDSTFYIAHRWDHWYKALTIKSPAPHDSIFDQPYFYEIDWQPDRITWRIGPDRDNMREVGFMDRSVTVIPDNQMRVVFTQEFHASKWWPMAPFQQDDVPYPLRDIKGEILEFWVE